MRVSACRDEIGTMKKVESAGRSVLRLSYVSAFVAATVVAALAVLHGHQGGGASWGVRALFALAGLMVVAPILGTARLFASRQQQLALLKEREAELSRLSWRLEFALAASQVGVWDVDLRTDELLWDARAKALFGLPDRPGFLSEADWTGALHPDDRARAMAEAAAAVAGDGRFVTEYRVVRPGGEVRHIRDMAARYEGADGSRRLVGLVWDVTADLERQAELNLRRLEAEAATVAKSRFLAAMSHEIRTPMSGVLGLLGLMLDGPLEPEQRQRATIALASAQGLLGILNDILDFSKLEANQIRVREEEVAVRQLVGEVMELMVAGAEQKGLQLTHSVAPAVPEWIVTDPMRLRQILTNLVSNATKFTDAGAVTVRVDYAADPEGRLMVEVEDTGIGISEEHCGQIFQHFVQADTSLSRRAGGTGLGLAISKRMVEMQGGTIAVESVLGQGSTFRVTLPVHVDEMMEAAE
jgi:signal transduction histidine kinase